MRGRRVGCELGAELPRQLAGDLHNGNFHGAKVASLRACVELHALFIYAPGCTPLL